MKTPCPISYQPRPCEPQSEYAKIVALHGKLATKEVLRTISAVERRELRAVRRRIDELEELLYPLRAVA